MISFFGTIYDIVICVICAGNLPIVNVSIFINMAPLFTVILAVWVLKERLTLFNFIQAIFSFLGVIMIIMGRKKIPAESVDA